MKVLQRAALAVVVAGAILAAPRPARADDPRLKALAIAAGIVLLPFAAGDSRSPARGLALAGAF